MLRRDRFRTHAWFIGLSVAIVLVVRMTFSAHYAEQRRTQQAQAVKARIRELATQWNALAYTNGTGSALADLVLGGLDWPSLKLSPVQESSLKSRLREVLEFMADPSFEEYYRLKTEGLSGRLTVSGRVTNLVADIGTRTSAFETPDTERVLRALWDFTKSSNAVSARILGISPNRIRATTTATNWYNAILNGRTANGLTIIVEAIEPDFVFGDQTSGASSDSAQGLFFHLSFFARSSMSSDAGPVYLSLYWSECDQRWALSRLFTDGVLKIRTLF